MTETEARSHDQKTLPPEMASAVNLLAHPMAGFAAMGAIGFGLAGHAMGLWLGSVAGAAEAARRLAEDGNGGASKPSQGRPSPNLRLVSSSDMPEAPAAAIRTMVADAENAMRNAVDAVADVIEEAAGSPATVRPVALAKPQTPDDLKAISGIGPKLERVLNGFGIWTYGQVAALTPEEIAWLDGELGFGGRIERDDWLGQARRLTGANGK